MMKVATNRSVSSHCRFAQSGFSLVEVVLAVGIVAFAFVAILGLLPAGMNQFRQTIDNTVSAEIAHRVITDAQQTDFDTLIDKADVPSEQSSNSYFAFRAPKVGQPEFRYFDERGEEVVPLSATGRLDPSALSDDERARVVYHVLVRVMPQSPVPETLAGVGGGKELATLTVQVARNPSNRAIKISTAGNDDVNEPNRQLFVQTPGVSFLTYSAQIARNQ